MLALAWWAWITGRRAQWRFLTVLTAFLAFAGLQLVFLAFRYCWELLSNIAQLGVSALGSAGCVIALVALKRYVFSPERVGRARLAAHGCPHCSTPFAGGQPRCWGCGRPLLDACPRCGAPHLRFAPHCSACGEAVPAPA